MLHLLQRLQLLLLLPGLLHVMLLRHRLLLLLVNRANSCAGPTMLASFSCCSRLLPASYLLAVLRGARLPQQQCSQCIIGCSTLKRQLRCFQRHRRPVLSPRGMLLRACDGAPVPVRLLSNGDSC